MTEEKFIHTNLKNELTHDFLVEILKHYHYEQKDMEMLKEVAGELRECLAGEEGFYCMTRRQCEQILNLCREENYAIGIFTLGSRVDELENRYSRTERLREAYAVIRIPLFIGIRCGVKLMSTGSPAAYPNCSSISGVWRCPATP